MLTTRRVDAFRSQDQMHSEGKNKETMNKHVYLLSSANARVVRNFYDATDDLSNQVIVWPRP
ncbi:hypothetical protein T12_6 [Trichinella patagoniensis]|uniref:Uncharacterized protein n=1 Tax=Trichinella patagoniensis TaxID=990121 RepID=A0A0V0Z2D4_9BILA|nr:hypothetical protein T12_10339 [Trichinella patagoniensis]KRY09645.1 hypothetical protein T12_6 [Trichinella patagoniensis]